MTSRWSNSWPPTLNVYDLRYDSLTWHHNSPSTVHWGKASQLVRNQLLFSLYSDLKEKKKKGFLGWCRVALTLLRIPPEPRSSYSSGSNRKATICHALYSVGHSQMVSYLPEIEKKVVSVLPNGRISRLWVFYASLIFLLRLSGSTNQPWYWQISNAGVRPTLHPSFYLNSTKCWVHKENQKTGPKLTFWSF